jgi:hypothetical protein
LSTAQQIPKDKTIGAVSRVIEESQQAYLSTTVRELWQYIHLVIDA